MPYFKNILIFSKEPSPVFLVHIVLSFSWILKKHTDGCLKLLWMRRNKFKGRKKKYLGSTLREYLYELDLFSVSHVTMRKMRVIESFRSRSIQSSSFLSLPPHKSEDAREPTGRKQNAGRGKTRGTVAFRKEIWSLFLIKPKRERIAKYKWKRIFVPNRVCCPGLVTAR